MHGDKTTDGRAPKSARLRGGLQATGDLIVMSRLLVLQSRRMLLASCARKMLTTGNEDLRAQIATLEEGARQARIAYRKAVLDWSSRDTPQFWLVSYEGMVLDAEELVARLRASAQELPEPDRGDVEADAVRLDQVIRRWRATMLSTITPEAA